MGEGDNFIFRPTFVCAPPLPFLNPKNPSLYYSKKARLLARAKEKFSERNAIVIQNVTPCRRAHFNWLSNIDRKKKFAYFTFNFNVKKANSSEVASDNSVFNERMKRDEGLL